MTTYRLWPSTNGPGTVTSYAGPFVGATSFAVKGGGNWLNGYYIWVTTGGDTSPSGGYNTALWSLTTGASSGSGTLVPGTVVTGVTGLTANAWNFIALPSPVQLAPGWDPNSTANGSMYVAAVGWTAANGFADTTSYWGSGGAGANGLTNGPLIGYSSNTGTSNLAPYGMAQGLFSSTTSNAASVMPNQVSGTDNFWVDVQVSDTAPAAYAGSYRLWPNKYDANSSTIGDAAVNYTVATEVTLAQSCTLNNAWYYSPTNLNGSTAATTLATRCDVWDISTGLSVASITSPSWLKPDGTSASAGAGWVKAAFAGGVTLPPGDYRVSVYNSGGTGDANWSAKDAGTDYWGETLTGAGSGGIANGPVAAPKWSAASAGFVFGGAGTDTPPWSSGGTAASHAQSVFFQPPANNGAAGFPQLYAAVGAGSNQTQNYWVDLEVTPVPVVPLAPPRAQPGKTWLRRFHHPQALPAVTPPAAITISGTAALTGAGAVADTTVTLISPASPAGAGTLAALVTQGAGATAAGAGTASPAVTEIAQAALAGAGAVTGAVAQGSNSSLSGAGTLNALVTEIAPAGLTGAGVVNANPGSAASGTASIAGAGTVTAKAVIIAPASPAGAGTLAAAAVLRVPAVITGAGTVTAAGMIPAAFTVGVLTAADAPGAALTATDQRTGGPG